MKTHQNDKQNKPEVKPLFIDIDINSASTDPRIKDLALSFAALKTSALEKYEIFKKLPSILEQSSALATLHAETKRSTARYWSNLDALLYELKIVPSLKSTAQHLTSDYRLHITPKWHVLPETSCELIPDWFFVYNLSNAPSELPKVVIDLILQKIVEMYLLSPLRVEIILRKAQGPAWTKDRVDSVLKELALLSEREEDARRKINEETKMAGEKGESLLH